jgi:hypothetical protein
MQMGFLLPPFLFPLPTGRQAQGGNDIVNTFPRGKAGMGVIKILLKQKLGLFYMGWL